MESGVKQQAQFLLLQYLEGKSTGTQVAQLFDLLEKETADTDWQEMLEELLTQEPALENYRKEDFLQVLDKIFHQSDQEIPQVPVRKIRTWKKWIPAAAASVIIALGVLSYFLVINRSSKEPASKLTTTELAKTDVAPGSFKAKLILDDGREITLDKSKNGELAREQNMTVTNNDGNLVYSENDQPIPEDHINHNTLKTANGETYATTLSDGTKVWLNSGSSITFPVVFTGELRTVRITGEAYFEVKHDERYPFMVMANNFIVRDLGTAFNVNSYNDEVLKKTTLVSGKAKVSGAGVSEIITPGQQVLVDNQGKVKLNLHPDMEQAVAWKNGLFNFEGAGLKDVLRQLQRWYDLTVVYEGAVPDIQFFGKMNRNVKLSTVLDALKGMGVHFRIEENNKLTVTK